MLNKSNIIILILHIAITFFAGIMWIQGWNDFFYVPIYFLLFCLGLIWISFIWSIKMIQQNKLLFWSIILSWFSITISRLFRPWSWDDGQNGIDFCELGNLSRIVDYGWYTTESFMCIESHTATFIADWALYLYGILIFILFIFWIYFKIKAMRTNIK